MTDSGDNTRRHPRVVNIDELPVVRGGKAPRYAYARQQLGAATGAQQLGVSHVELPPGARGWPFHCHAANEEGIFVLAGRGRVRLGDGEIEVRAGDYVALPAGLEGAHQTFNDSDAPLRYLCFSTMVPTDIAIYPDSNKIGLFGGGAPGAKGARFLEGFLKLERVDYYDGEDTGEG